MALNDYLPLFLRNVKEFGIIIQLLTLKMRKYKSLLPIL